MNWQGTLKTKWARPGAFDGVVADGRVRAVVFSTRVKVAYTIFVGLLLPLHWTYPGGEYFLWFSDLALVLTAVALWFERRLLASMMALAVLAPEIAWNVGFFNRLAGGADFFGLAAYMFEPSTPWRVRLLSLSHVLLPALLLWMVYRLGYEPRALRAQTLLAWAVLAGSYALAETSARDVNWALGVGDNLARAWLPGWLWLLVLMIAYPALVYIPTHVLLRALFGKRRAVTVRPKPLEK